MNKLLRKLKKAYKKIKYRNRLTTRFYITFISISSFILFLGGTYSYFNIFEHDNAAVITIAKLKYMLTSENANYQNNSITVSAGQTLDLTLNLKSLNNIRTRYALVYASPSSDVKVYYDGLRDQNVLGEISTLNSIIDIQIVIENNSTEDQIITFELKGGYVQNTLDSNITDRYDRIYIVTLDPSGGTVSPTSITVTKGTSYGSLPTPTRSGYEFLGWFTTSTGGDQITSETIANISSNQTLYAQWENVNEYKVKQVLNKLGITPKHGNPSFNTIATAYEGVYGLEDNYGISYYYRGAADNNYVKFGDYYWRIIRINGDGTLRIIYDGKSPYRNSVSSSDRVALTDVPYNDSYHEDVKYVGYMFGGALEVASTSKSQAQSNETSSNIKNVLENWYKNNIKSKNLDNFVADNIFCNDRSTMETNATSFPNNTGKGYADYQTEYGAASRHIIWKSFSTPEVKSTPLTTLKCLQKNDSFTKDDTVMGNGSLEEKIGLITTDEINAAGGVWLTNNKYFYLYKGVDYWTMSPWAAWRSSYGLHPDMFYYTANDGLNNIAYPEPTNVAPVINLTYDYVMQMIGDGTIDNVFKLS